ncbi:DUF6331 family protein [Armatimonas rosea]|uniref:Uncharacterized protein n=1 Tax=Armatimonas rosea TaxID=685828 RepID=A0A7W9WAI9_ARMRO|nr:hypothetical protein [Armatimonas rosea]
MRKAISIGTEQWINVIDLTGHYDRAIEIDPLLVQLEPMWAALETHCVAECCGLDAFDFTPEAVAHAGARLDAAVVCANLGELRSSIAALGTDVLVSTRLNSYVDYTAFDRLISHLQTCFCQTASHGNQHRA